MAGTNWEGSGCCGNGCQVRGHYCGTQWLAHVFTQRQLHWLHGETEMERECQKIYSSFNLSHPYLYWFQMKARLWRKIEMKMVPQVALVERLKFLY